MVAHRLWNLDNYCSNNYQNDLIKEFPKIEIIYESDNNQQQQQQQQQPLYYRLKKEKEVEPQRIGCNPLKRLDKELTRPIKQLLMIDNGNNNSNNSNINNCDTINLIKEIRKLKLNIDINTVILNNHNINSNTLISDVVNELPKTPVIVGLSNESSNKILEFLEKESNPLFPFTILNLDSNKEIKKLRNLTDIYILKDSKKDNSNNNNNIYSNNSNIRQVISSDNFNHSTLNILEKEIE
ncbi:hypothetical protein DICPUDRAFT_82334 [Dictyostelium purpureum]|uniref:Uncharacterized protein n=1 Tax=Dictyostelium purpureum TaxID=5786 RepID=F0ZW80_DICPU|nr:uncharacterized protein DICPUDRAFT_82334 [Dictyostelium purpureum]EGC31802.1 hypothetical protein DICPUDRAFT_82334 [Dictyostelium purpureum]|eukprot:XP_003291669.1 hypothetical protein DICPUDRAFT_82334 [Dictyostelium purpureum]